MNEEDIKAMLLLTAGIDQTTNWSPTDEITVHKMGNGTFVAERVSASGERLPHVFGAVRDGNSIRLHQEAVLNESQKMAFERLKSHVLKQLLADKQDEDGSIFLFANGDFPEIFKPFSERATIYNCAKTDQMEVVSAFSDLLELLGYVPLIVSQYDDEGHWTAVCVAEKSGMVYPIEED